MNKPKTSFIKSNLKKTFKTLFQYKILILFTLTILTSFFWSPIPVLAVGEDRQVDIEILGLKLGEVNLANYSFPVITFLIAFVDGFNPCAMSVLLFLISILFEIKEGWKRWYLGGLFILTIGVSQFLFLTAWLETNRLLGLIAPTRIIIAIAAWVFGVWSLNEWWKMRQENKNGGCKVTEQGKNKKLFSKMQEVLHRKNLFLSSLGIVGIGLSVAIFEASCTAALPAIWTKLLVETVDNVAIQYLYILLYTLVFIFDEALVFIISMITLEKTGLTSKYNGLVKLLGGILMIGVSLSLGWEFVRGILG